MQINKKMLSTRQIKIVKSNAQEQREKEYLETVLMFITNYISIKKQPRTNELKMKFPKKIYLSVKLPHRHYQLLKTINSYKMYTKKKSKKKRKVKTF